MKMYKIFLLLSLFLFALVIIPQNAFAQQEEPTNTLFNAKVISVLDEKVTTDETGDSIVSQKLELKGLEGKWKDKNIIFDGILYEAVGINTFEVGDTVIVVASTDVDGNDLFFVTEYVRQGSLYWLAALFALAVIFVGRLKGVRALIVLFLSFLIILKFILPLILDGKNPLFISIAGCFFILLISIYLTEGFKRSSTIAVGSITISLLFTGFLSVLFTHLTKLTGYANEEAFFLKNQLRGDINIEGLLLAGIIIGALGVLDDVVVSQIEVIAQLKSANPNMTKKELYKKAMKVGVTHMSAMVNTLFLAYLGASLPLLLLFTTNEANSLTFSQVINNEVITTEIVRTLTGSIGLVLAAPLATLFGIIFLRSGDKQKNKEKPLQVREII